MPKASEPPKGSALRPRARLIRTLGDELISSEVVAVIELVKNSYDADATRVLIRFTEPMKLNEGRIEIIDNGHGMRLDTVQTVWMEPATPSKRVQEIRRSESLKRRYLGEKGIGRFASSRLANELEVFSRREGSQSEVYALFDWRQFDDDTKYLDEILILWEERAPGQILPGGTIQLLWRNEKKQPSAKQLSKGTILRMTGLKQTWEAKHFEDLRRGLARLISPRLGKDAQPDFQVTLDLPTTFAQFSSKVEAPPILNHPHYTVKGSVQEDGVFSITYKILAEGVEKQIRGRFVRIKNTRGDFELRDVGETDQPVDDATDNNRSLACGPLSLELRVWDRDELGNVVQKTHSTIQDTRRDLDAVAGINIYRDQFRVLPYGEPQDDWIRLDLRRVQNPTLRLSNNQIYGVVHISADTNPNLRDQSNREGLDENQAMEDLRDVMTAVLNRLETLRYAARPRVKGKTIRPVGGLFAGFDLKPLADYISKEIPDNKKAQDLIQQTELAFSGQLKEIQTVLARYQRLATLGQLIDHVLHEGRQPIASINNEAVLGLEDVRQAESSQSIFIAKASARFKAIRKQGDVVATAFRRMEPFGGRRRGRPVQLYLEEIVNDGFSLFSDNIKRLGVRIDLPHTQTLVRVDSAEIQEVFINLLQNSLYWLEQVDEEGREIVVTIERKEPDTVEILFSDSGPGVPRENRQLIFDPYFSTKPDGIGLGLSIIGEIVSDYYGGSLELLERGALSGANFLITLKKRI